HLKEEAERVLQGARQLAEEIETRHRRTATNTSLQDARKQFPEAQEDLSKRVTL
ncbi:MAG: hypothetical protein RLZ94_153, partial [Actinomycetota bacterium]